MILLGEFISCYESMFAPIFFSVASKLVTITQLAFGNLLSPFLSLIHIFDSNSFANLARAEKF